MLIGVSCLLLAITLPAVAMVALRPQLQDAFSGIARATPAPSVAPSGRTLATLVASDPNCTEANVRPAAVKLQSALSYWNSPSQAANDAVKFSPPVGLRPHILEMFRTYANASSVEGPDCFLAWRDSILLWLRAQIDMYAEYDKPGFSTSEVERLRAVVQERGSRVLPNLVRMNELAGIP